MCLIRRAGDRRPRTRKTVYKVLRKVPQRNKLVAPYHNSFEYKPGVNRAIGKSYSKTWLYAGVLHCYQDKADAEHMRARCEGCDRAAYVVVEMTAIPTQWVACGIDRDAAYTKLRLTKREYERALEEARKIEKSRLAAA